MAVLLILRLKEKKRRGEPLSREDLAGLAMTPVMGSQRSKKDRIFDAVLLVRDEPGEDAQKVVALLYAFAEKFLNDSGDLEALREVMGMTRLGQMLFDEGLEQGREQGLIQGREQGQDLMNRLTGMLLADERIDDLKRAVLDRDYQKQLLHEYHIEAAGEIQART